MASCGACRHPVPPPPAFPTCYHPTIAPRGLLLPEDYHALGFHDIRTIEESTRVRRVGPRHQRPRERGFVAGLFPRPVRDTLERVVICPERERTPDEIRELEVLFERPATPEEIDYWGHPFAFCVDRKPPGDAPPIKTNFHRDFVPSE